MTHSLRKLTGTIGLVLAVVIAVAVPAGYFYVGYSEIVQTLAFKSRLNAARISQYIYTHDILWQYQRLRLIELVQLPGSSDEPVHQRIYDHAGRLVLDDGPELRAPRIGRSTPIVVNGATVGSLEAQTSLHDLVDEIWIVAVLSIILGIAVYLAIRLLPMRVLDKALDMLGQTRLDLAEQNRRLDAALTNMSQGLCMFDANAHLVIHNKRFADIYGLPSDRVRPGATPAQLMALGIDVGALTSEDGDNTLALHHELVRENKEAMVVQHLKDGRSITISHRPMASGGFVATFDDITERLRAEERIRHLAQFDALTELPNRVTFYERVENLLAHLRRAETVAILSLDLDRFKSVNDTLGHPIGDLLLQRAAERMRGCVREEDIVARLGGDEFAVVQVPSEPVVESSTLAARLIEVVGAPYDLDGHQVIVGVSVGIAVAPSDGDKPDTLMKNADLALYRAKADGGGVYRFFEIGMDARMQARRALELDLRRAILKSEFSLHYQPIIDVKTGRITGCEALIRWNHPERGMVSPAEFIPIAEVTGLIVPLGEFVLKRACADAMRWPSDIVVAVNLSPAQFKSRKLLESVVEALKQSGLPPERLELEITEMVLLQESEGAFAALHELRALGIKIAMDDFGTGYSSLGYLRSFPFDKIKIDQSFIRDLSVKEDSVAIVRAVVGLSSSLGVTTTAEGVETKEQLARLTSEGCDEVQGFLFSPPRPADEIEHIISQTTGPAAAVA